MAVRFYDEALVKKISNWTKNSKGLTVLKPEETTRFFEMTLDQIKDKTLTLPLIAISRDKNIDILNMQKQAKTFDGYSLHKSKNAAIPINVVPIRLGYQIDVYTRGIAEADEYMRNFIFNFINYPKLEVTLPYNDFDIQHQSIIHLDSTVTDNSDIKEHLFADQFTRFTFKLIIEDAYLFSIPIQEPAQIIDIATKYTDHDKLY